MLAWVFCNFALGAVVLNSAGLDRFSKKDSSSSSDSDNEKAMIYMAVVLWSVVAISCIKFIGAMWYLVVRMVSLPFNPLSYISFTNNVIVPRCLKFSILSVCLSQHFMIDWIACSIPPLPFAFGYVLYGWYDESYDL